MFGLPPLPGWDGLHPLIVHFPVALLIVVPLFILLGLIRKPWRRAMMTSALLLMVLGTAATWVAVPTGEAAGKLAERSPAMNLVLEQHESLAETTRTLFTILTAIFAVMLIGLKSLKREADLGPTLAVHVPFLALYLAGLLVLANTAHNGGRLVHEFGTLAMSTGAGAPAGEAAPGVEAPASTRPGDGDD